MNTMPIGPGTKVTLHFALKLADGAVVDSNFEGQPATFTVGDGSLLEGFERVLFGLAAGDEQEFVLTPEHAFGQWNPANVQQFPRKQFADLPLELGLVLSFADANKGELPGVIAEIGEERVKVDFNHPLAGKDIHFSVRILQVEAA
ncbi:FKBP-type peptidyl-prolyl cis-trans isomerase [Balneatrix alpica]|uniref:FKBP-type peptidyl-prolyl cis-trans isomerase n=1 Tax=Balneatrix alpica TaxID=75684 RepID=UPI00273824C3|nr:FKBP-type peptidyl-prolyl cis-trans isomerase [Balneatrix alpica]